MDGDRSVLDRELDTPLGQGGGMFCGVSEEQFAINGVTYKWPVGSKLAWGIAFSRLGSLSDMDCKDAITAWMAEIVATGVDIKFEYVKNANAANIKYTSQRLDGQNGVLADMQVPVGNVSVDSTQLLGRFDDSEQWGLFENPPQGRIDFYRTGLHETLHALGLGHAPASLQRPALIARVYSPVVRYLQPPDVQELLRRYPKSATPVEPPPPTEVPGAVPIVLEHESTVIQGNKKWQAKIKTTLTRVV